jgi:23S rRNA (cytidine1920-2'-O)/16S rRNA (cytidine1409-2'-O)-methyltransferase
MAKQRLDQLMAQRAMVSTRSQAESWIKLGKVSVDGKVVTKPGYFAREDSVIELKARDRYVSRAGLKLASVARSLGVDFKGKTVLDVGSSTGGFTDYALQNGAKYVYAVDVGTDQLHPTLRKNKRISLHEKTDIRDFIPRQLPDVVVMDVSFISLREILPHIADISGPDTRIVAMVKPQFEAGKHQVNKGVLKNDNARRQVLREFELWSKDRFVIIGKADSEVAGAKGNRERFYLLAIIA